MIGRGRTKRGTVTETRDWRQMWEHVGRRLEETTGAPVETWKERIAEAAPPDEASLRRWLDERGVTGYGQSLLVMERFGYPEFLVASADELIDGQYADRQHLRPVLERVLAEVAVRYESAAVQARKTYVALETPRRQFAVVKPTTRTRVDLGLRLDGHEPGGLLLAARRLANETINVRIALAAPDDLDEAALAWLDRAWERST